MSLDAVIFDLDYTLYDQSQYVRGALVDVAHVIAGEVAADGRALVRSLIQMWRGLGTGHDSLFDLWLDGHGLRSPTRVERCVSVFHRHRPASLRPYSGAHEMLERLRASYHVGIITDGHVGMQRIKIWALGLAEHVHTIVYSAALSRRKPDPEVFRHALDLAGVAPQAAVFVGDHPVRDIHGARQVGMRTIRVMTGEFQHVPDHPGSAPDDRLHSLRRLPTVLATLPWAVSADCRPAGNTAKRRTTAAVS